MHHVIEEDQASQLKLESLIPSSQHAVETPNALYGQKYVYTRMHPIPVHTFAVIIISTFLGRPAWVVECG